MLPCARDLVAGQVAANRHVNESVESFRCGVREAPKLETESEELTASTEKANGYGMHRILLVGLVNIKQVSCCTRPKEPRMSPAQSELNSGSVRCHRIKNTPKQILIHGEMGPSMPKMWTSLRGKGPAVLEPLRRCDVKEE